MLYNFLSVLETMGGGKEGRGRKGGKREERRKEASSEDGRRNNKKIKDK